MSCTLVVTNDGFNPTSTGGFPAACLPRCAAATRTAYDACTDASCRTMAVEADRTPSVPFSINGTRYDQQLDCALCSQLQSLRCLGLACPAEADAMFRTCITRTASGTCATTIAAANTCQAALSEERRAQVAACNASSRCF